MAERIAGWIASLLGFAAIYVAVGFEAIFTWRGAAIVVLLATSQGFAAIEGFERAARKEADRG